MKIIILMMGLLISYQGLCQFNEDNISVTFRGGYNMKYDQGLLAPGLQIYLNGITFGPEMIINVGNDKPVSFGMKAGYKHFINDDWAIGMGGGAYLNIYGLDDYDKYRNGWAPLAYASIHYNEWYLEYNFINGNVISIGVTGLLSYLE